MLEDIIQTSTTKTYIARQLKDMLLIRVTSSKTKLEPVQEYKLSQGQATTEHIKRQPNKRHDTRRHSRVDEATVMAKFGMALRDVADMRDTYVTTVCDVCEQLIGRMSPR